MPCTACRVREPVAHAPASLVADEYGETIDERMVVDKSDTSQVASWGKGWEGVMEGQPGIRDEQSEEDSDLEEFLLEGNAGEGAIADGRACKTGAAAEVNKAAAECAAAMEEAGLEQKLDEDGEVIPEELD